MTLPTKMNLKVIQGSTFTETFRWESATKVYKPITAVTNAAPMVVTAVGHGMPIGWRAKITNVGGMKEINSTSTYHIATGITNDTCTFNSINAVGYSTYTTGGILEYNAPTSLTGVTARMQIRDKITSTTTLDELTTENGKIVIDDVLKTITILLSATVTQAYTFKSAVYSMELVSGAVVTPFINGTITLDTEITR